MSTDLVLSPFDNSLIPEAEALQQIADFLNLNVAEGDAADNTIRAYLGHIQQFVDWCGENAVAPGQATKHDLTQYRRWLAEQDYEHSTIGAKLAALRRFYEAAQQGGYRADNPASGLKSPRVKTTRRDQILKRYLSRAQIESVLAVPDTSTVNGLRDKTILIVLYLQMLRVSEVAKLDVQDIVGNRLHIRGGKGRKDRVVVLAAYTLEWLNRWLPVRQIHARNHALFISLGRATYGQRLSINGVRYVVNQAEQVAGVYRPGVSCHAWRHAAATHAVSMGASIVAVSAMLGHADIKTTSVYTHVADAEAENPAAYLEQNLEDHDE
ncbi:MAG: tyrosine-type recombinase/integrase [Anaerolineae bacterium]|nr:tyrosine-type recombinase/integrase [Anaerolineae bacterium]